VNKGGAPKGNQNATKGRLWNEAIRKVLAEGDKQALVRVARKLVNAAEEGDIQAIRELGDRLDGKPNQSISGPDDGPIHHKVEQVIVDPEG
jgi:hypothetical protein